MATFNDGNHGENRPGSREINPSNRLANPPMTGIPTARRIRGAVDGGASASRVEGAHVSVVQDQGIAGDQVALVDAGRGDEQAIGGIAVERIRKPKRVFALTPSGAPGACRA